MSMFASPGAASGGWAVADAENHLVVIDVHSHETGIVTSLGEKDAIKAPFPRPQSSPDFVARHSKAV